MESGLQIAHYFFARLDARAHAPRTWTVRFHWSARCAARRLASCTRRWRSSFCCAASWRCGVSHACVPLPICVTCAFTFMFGRCCFPPQCPWPLDEADVEVLCVAATDERVALYRAALKQRPSPRPQPRRCAATAAASASSVASSMPPPAPHRDSSAETDELQRISNMLMQSTPTSSPALRPGEPHVHRLPSLDSLPPSTLLGPAAGSAQSHEMAAFELPPTFPAPPAP